MRLRLFCHSIESDWNHGNAHFLRGVCDELLGRGHEVEVFEPVGAWSRMHLVADHGAEALEDFRRAYPRLRARLYDPARLDVERALADADVVLVHEWTDPALVRRLGAVRERSCKLLFHDTHHRAASDRRFAPASWLRGYDGVLAFGRCLAELYERGRWAERVWVWHEAADVRRFRPLPAEQKEKENDVVWIGNWGDDERTEELATFLLGPVQRLGLRGDVYGVRYPPEAVRLLDASGMRYRGWLANHRVPFAYACSRVTVHVPRRPYARTLPGIPTIRVFEALACGIPLVCAPWDDVEGLFEPGRDFLIARDGTEMDEHLRELLEDPDRARSLSAQGLATIRARHTCAHRADELLAICAELGALTSRPAPRLEPCAAPGA